MTARSDQYSTNFNSKNKDNYAIRNAAYIKITKTLNEIRKINF